MSAFPAVVGPALLVLAQEHGAAFAARTASGTLLGLGSLAAFAVAYGRAALRSAWPCSLAAGWLAAAVAGAAVGGLRAGLPVGVLLASASLAAAFAALPSTSRPAPLTELPWPELPLRMGITALLVASLAYAARVVSPLVTGILAALPVLASVLAVFTHRRQDGDGVVALLRGMIAGMVGFVAFCWLVAVLVVPVGVALAFASATAAAVAVQAAVLLWPRRARPRQDVPGAAAPTAPR